MKKPVLDYKFAMRTDMRFAIKRLTAITLFAVMGSVAIGLVLNYCLRMLGTHGGMYTVYIICGFALTMLYMYFHEFAHALGVLLVKGKLPEIKFGKYAASCGSQFLTFTKAQYFFVASLPLVLYCLILVPLCVLLPPVYFPMPFMPLCYNIFGSMGDMYMLNRMLRIRGRAVIVDSGTEVCAYLPVTHSNSRDGDK